MKLEIRLPVTAVRIPKTTMMLHEGGILRAYAGDWLIYGEGFGPMTVTTFDEIGAVPLALPEDVAEEILRSALEKGYF